MNKIAIENLNKKVVKCVRCPEKASKTILLGRQMHGQTREVVDILFLGQAPQPGRYEHIKQRSVFGEYGPTGKRLFSFISLLEERISGLSCWGTNCVKCDVKKYYIKSAIANCRNYLVDELNLLKPKVIVMLGSDVIDNLTREKLSVGRVSKWSGYPCIHSYHPMERTGRFAKYKEILMAAILQVLKKSSLNLRKEDRIFRSEQDKHRSFSSKGVDYQKKPVFLKPKKKNREYSSDQRKDFWRGLEEFASKKTSGLRFLSPHPNYYDIDFGFRKPTVYISAKMTQNSLRCEIDIPNAHKSDIYQHFLSHKKDIEKEFGESLEWIEKPKTLTIRRIRVSRDDFSIDNKGKRVEYYEWLIKKINKFQRVFNIYKK